MSKRERNDQKEDKNPKKKVKPNYFYYKQQKISPPTTTKKTLQLQKSRSSSSSSLPTKTTTTTPQTQKSTPLPTTTTKKMEVVLPQSQNSNTIMPKPHTPSPPSPPLNVVTNKVRHTSHNNKMSLLPAYYKPDDKDVLKSFKGQDFIFVDDTNNTYICTDINIYGQPSITAGIIAGKVVQNLQACEFKKKTTIMTKDTMDSIIHVLNSFTRVY